MGNSSSLIGKKFDSEPIYGDSDKFIKTKINSNGSNDYDLMQKAMNFNDVTIVSVKESDYRIHFLIFEQRWCNKRNEKFWFSWKK